MLNPNEKKNLKNRDCLENKARQNLDYRVAKKIDNYLSDLEELNNVLLALPEKTAMRAIHNIKLDDLFELTLTILRLLRVSPVGLDLAGNGHITRLGPGKTSKDGKRVEFTASLEPATSEDAFRHGLLERHIEALQHLIDFAQITPSGATSAPLRPLFSCGAISLEMEEGLNRIDPLWVYRKKGLL